MTIYFIIIRYRKYYNDKEGVLHQLNFIFQLMQHPRLYCGISEVYIQIIIDAVKKLFHLLYRRLTRIGTCAGVCDRIDSDVMLSCLEDVFRNKALLCRIAVSAIVLNAV